MAFIYDAFRIKRKAIKTSNIVTCVEDFVYWVIVALVMFYVMYYSNDGEIRGYIYIGTIIGVIVYFIFFSRLVINTSMFILKILYTTIKWVIKIIIYPIKIIYKVVKVPAKLIAKMAGNVSKKVKERLIKEGTSEND